MNQKQLQLKSLSELCLLTLAQNIRKTPSLSGLPEYLVKDLFERVLAQGRLTPQVLETFERTGHKSVLDHIEGLNIQQLPPVLPITHKKWLGW